MLASELISTLMERYENVPQVIIHDMVSISYSSVINSPGFLSGHGINHLADKAPERLVLDILLVNLSIILKERLHNFVKSLVMCYPRCMWGIVLCVLIGNVGCYFGRDVIPNTLDH